MKNECWMVQQATRMSDDPAIVIPACDRDCQMMMKNLQWMRDLDGKQNYSAVIAQDQSMNKILAKQLHEEVRQSFTDVTLYVYDRPPTAGWPFGANWAFQHTAWYFYYHGKRPWFWCEADCVPLRPGWMAKWYGEYSQVSADKPIMGSIVDGRGHCNGTAIYPACFAELSPAAMSAYEVAWDWVMKPETIHLTHDTKLMCHVWGIENGKPSPYGGNAAFFATQSEVSRWVCPGAVLFHRSKDGTLIDRLRERRAAQPLAIPAGGGGGGVMVL